MSHSSSESSVQKLASAPAESSSPVRALATPALGALIGALAAAPLVFTAPPLQSFLLCLGGCVLGGLVGYKRRNSAGFFYFSLIVACMLATTLANKMFAEPAKESPSPQFSESGDSVRTQP